MNRPRKTFEFFDATWLPSGKIIAVSNIGYNGVPCVNGNDEVGNMVLYNPEDRSLRRLTFDQDANWSPVTMHNGKVMYTRWEYTDLTHYFSRFVMHMNPDGTEQKAFYGSGSYFPNSTFDAKPIPGQASGFVGIISDTMALPVPSSDPVRSLQRPQVGTGNGAGTAIPRPQDRTYRERPAGGWCLASVYQALSVER